MTNHVYVQEKVELVVRYLDEKFGKAKKYRFSEDRYAYHVVAWYNGAPMPNELKCFDEERGIFGGRKVFCYDEVEGWKMSVLLQISKRGVDMVLVSLFKPDAPVVWPPRPLK